MDAAIEKNFCGKQQVRWRDASCSGSEEVFQSDSCFRKEGRVEHVAIDQIGDDSHFPNWGVARRHFPQPVIERDDSMDFFSNTWVIVAMIVMLLALIGVMIFLRMKPKDDE
jgi:hypothetical protein